MGKAVADNISFFIPAWGKLIVRFLRPIPKNMERIFSTSPIPPKLEHPGCFVGI